MNTPTTERGADLRAAAALDEAIQAVGTTSGIDLGGTGGDWVGPRPSIARASAAVHGYGAVVVGVYADSDRGEQAQAALRRAGFHADQLGVAVCCGPVAWACGILVDGGCADHGPFEVLVGLGVPTDAARLYQRDFDACCTIVAVRAVGRTAEAAAILRRPAGRRRGRVPARR